VPSEYRHNHYVPVWYQKRMWLRTDDKSNASSLRSP